VLLQFKEVFAPAETLLKNVEVLLRGKGGGEPYKVQLAVLARAGCDCDCDCDVATRANQLSRCRRRSAHVLWHVAIVVSELHAHAHARAER
jgi:hypothetical protein